MNSVRSNLWIPLVALLVGSTAGCKNQELRRLREENRQLREEIEQLSKTLSAPEVKLMPVREFTIGLAATEKGFDEAAFLGLLRESLQEASTQDSRFAVQIESDEQQIAKVRGMLIQQYLGEQKVPVKISNITYKLKDAGDDFTVGGSLVPRDGLETETTPDKLVRCSYRGALLSHMSRDSAGQYSIAYADSSGREGRIPVIIRDVEVFDPDQPPRAARQGEIALNWQLSLEKIQVYRVRHFAGDLGRFEHRMRYPRQQSSINQYQTIRDWVMLFGYGPYSTELLSRISTPEYINRVEVLPVTQSISDQLESGIAEDDLSRLLASSGRSWIQCSYVGFSEAEKLWERPVSVSVSFPFVSRQISNEKGLVFYTKYDTKGPVLIGDFPVSTR